MLEDASHSAPAAHAHVTTYTTEDVLKNELYREMQVDTPTYTILDAWDTVMPLIPASSTSSALTDRYPKVRCVSTCATVANSRERI